MPTLRAERLLLQQIFMNLERSPEPRWFEVMVGASYYREQADHIRRLAEMAWQGDLQDVLRGLAADYEEIAEDLEAGVTGIRHPELLREYAVGSRQPLRAPHVPR